MYTSNFTGAQVDAILERSNKFINYTQIQNNTDLNSIVSVGNYGIVTQAVANTLNGWPSALPKGGATLYVRPVTGYDTGRVWQILIVNTRGEFAIRKSSVNQDSFDPWYYHIPDGGYNKKGTTSQRPIFESTTAELYRGFVYFDTEVGKPIFFTNDTSDGKSGWVDATGASV